MTDIENSPLWMFLLAGVSSLIMVGFVVVVGVAILGKKTNKRK